MSPDLQELVALALVVAVVALNLWWHRRRKRQRPDATPDCAGCPKSAALPTPPKPRLVQLGGRRAPGRE